MRLSLMIAVVVGLTACQQKADEQLSSNRSNAPSAESGIKGLHREYKGKAAPRAEFNGPDGKTVRIGDFKGKPVLVNLWASWCAPCVKELPTLDRLSRSTPIEVLAVSQDSGPHSSVVAFMKAHDITALKSYQDPNMGLSGALGPDTVLPTSILFDANGNEIWRYVGELDWTGPQAASLLAQASVPAKRG